MMSTDQLAPKCDEKGLTGDMLVTRQKAAELLTAAGFQIAASTLAKKAVQGDGPKYQMWNGRAVYSVAVLMAWAKSQAGPVLRSTAGRSRSSNH